MDNLLQGMTHVVAYFEDILISGRSEQEHLDNLERVFKKCLEAGMRLKSEICQFMLPKVDYLGHRITKEGIKPTDKKVRAITHAHTPNNVFELRSFWGLLIFTAHTPNNVFELRSFWGLLIFTINSYQTFLLF